MQVLKNGQEEAGGLEIIDKISFYGIKLQEGGGLTISNKVWSLN